MMKLGKAGSEADAILQSVDASDMNTIKFEAGFTTLTIKRPARPGQVWQIPIAGTAATVVYAWNDGKTPGIRNYIGRHTHADKKVLL